MMLDGVALPFICAADPTFFNKWFACLSEMINHPLLLEEEKYLGLWLAIQSTKNESFTCSFNYEQISQAMSKSSRKVHRILTRLRIIGFYIVDLPIYYGEPTPEMVQKVYTFKLNLSFKSWLVKKDENAVVLPYIRSSQKITFNLISSFEATKKKDGKLKEKGRSLITSLMSLV